MAELYSCKDSTNLQNKGDEIIVYIRDIIPLRKHGKGTC